MQPRGMAAPGCGRPMPARGRGRGSSHGTAPVDQIERRRRAHERRPGCRFQPASAERGDGSAASAPWLGRAARRGSDARPCGGVGRGPLVRDAGGAARRLDVPRRSPPSRRRAAALGIRPRPRRPRPLVHASRAADPRAARGSDRERARRHRGVPAARAGARGGTRRSGRGSSRATRSAGTRCARPRGACWPRSRPGSTPAWRRSSSRGSGGCPCPFIPR